MYTKSFASAALPALLALTAAALPNKASPNRLSARQIPTGPCSTGVHVIAASGDGANNIGGYGLIGTLVTSIVAAIPDSSNVTLDYPKDSDNGIYFTGVGVVNLNQYIADYYSSCPTTKIVLLGYSAGAIITFNTICGASAPWNPNDPISPDLASTIIGIIGYGDETFVGGLPYDAGTCTGAGRFPRANPALCDPFADAIQNYCNADDPQCCKGFIPDAHFTYPAEFDSVATDFIVSRYQQNPSGPVVTSSSSSASLTVITTTSTSTSLSTLTSSSSSTSLILSSSPASSDSVIVSSSPPAVASSVFVASSSADLTAPTFSTFASTTTKTLTSTVTATRSTSVLASSEIFTEPITTTIILPTVPSSYLVSDAPTVVPVYSVAPPASSAPESSVVAPEPPAPTSAIETSAAAAPPAPTSAAETSAPAPAPSTAGPAPPPAQGPSTPEPVPAPEPAAGSCPVDLATGWEFPHLIVPVSASQPDTAFGTSYNGLINSDTSSIFNFDIPPSYEGKTCSLIFLLPKLEDLVTSSYNLTDSDGFFVEGLSGPALLETTYNSIPSTSAELGYFTVSPGETALITSGPCAAGARIGYKLCAGGDFAIDWFQDYNDPPIGLYIRSC